MIIRGVRQPPELFSHYFYNDKYFSIWFDAGQSCTRHLRSTICVVCGGILSFQMLLSNFTELNLILIWFFISTSFKTLFKTVFSKQKHHFNLCVHVVNSQLILRCKKQVLNDVIKGFRYTNEILKVYIYLPFWNDLL